MAFYIKLLFSFEHLVRIKSSHQELKAAGRIARHSDTRTSEVRRYNR